MCEPLELHPTPMGPQVGQTPAAWEEIVGVYEAAQEFIATTTVFRQPASARDAFTRLAVSVLTAKAAEAGNALGQIDTGDEA